MSYRLNDTSEYHRSDMESLGWELTVCNMLEPAASPVRDVLRKDMTFGHLLLDYLSKHAPLDRMKNILEVGGGYGFIMRDCIERLRPSRVTMLDISPFLLEKQRQCLSPFTGSGITEITFIEADFFSLDRDALAGFDLAMFNENIGDFLTVCGLEAEAIHASHGKAFQDSVIGEIGRMYQTYGMTLPEGVFNFNLGAARALERLCLAGIPVIYMSEHSCEATTPPYLDGKISIRPTGNPERISLKGHDEYTIRFSDLVRIGRYYGYSVVRNQYCDFIEVDYSDRINFILTSHSSRDEHEIIRHFIEDLVKYEALVLVREG